MPHSPDFNPAPLASTPFTPTPLRYGSVCSGIEAVSLAWRSLGFEPLWFAEIDPFANALLSHHYPDVPNLGDMTGIARRIRAGAVPTPDILIGGTPCQSYPEEIVIPRFKPPSL